MRYFVEMITKSTIGKRFLRKFSVEGVVVGGKKGSKLSLVFLIKELTKRRKTYNALLMPAQRQTVELERVVFYV